MERPNNQADGGRHDRRYRRDDGAASIEMAILAPAIIALFVVLMIAGRISTARQAIEAAAFDAARTASLARDAGQAQERAESAATATLASQGLTCATLTVTVDASRFAVPVGEPAQVTATVVCHADFSDIALPGMPGNTTLSSSFVSPLDQYRSRTS